MTMVSVRNIASAGCLAGLMLCGGCFSAPAVDNSSLGMLSPVIAQAKSISQDSIVKNGVFTISAGDYIRSLNENYGRITDCDLSADYGLTSNGVTMKLTIEDRSGEVASGSFYDANDKAIALYNLGRPSCYSSLTVFFDDYDDKVGDYIGETMMTVILTSDPALSDEDMQSLCEEWLDSAVADGDGLMASVSKNGITYTLAAWDGGEVWAIDVKAG